MKINKDLVDATMMLSFIILVLIGTSEYTTDDSDNDINIDAEFIFFSGHNYLIFLMNNKLFAFREMQ